MEIARHLPCRSGVIGLCRQTQHAQEGGIATTAATSDTAPGPLDELLDVVLFRRVNSAFSARQPRSSPEVLEGHCNPSLPGDRLSGGADGLMRERVHFAGPIISGFVTSIAI